MLIIMKIKKLNKVNKLLEQLSTSKLYHKCKIKLRNNNNLKINQSLLIKKKLLRNKRKYQF